jgi:hypothetical protein
MGQVTLVMGSHLHLAVPLWPKTIVNMETGQTQQEKP